MSGVPFILRARRADVADILERETKSTIANWLARVDAEPDVLTIRLTAEDRCAHLPELFADLVTRLRDPLPMGTRALMSDAAVDHGTLRREQGYTAAMLVEESRMLQVSIFETVQWHQKELDMSLVMLDVMAIADEVDSQLAQATASYIFEADSDPLSELDAPGARAPSDMVRNAFVDTTLD
jgi:hypothetical protein